MCRSSCDDWYSQGAFPLPSLGETVVARDGGLGVLRSGGDSLARVGIIVVGYGEGESKRVCLTCV